MGAKSTGLAFEWGTARSAALPKIRIGLGYVFLNLPVKVLPYAPYDQSPHSCVLAQIFAIFRLAFSQASPDICSGEDFFCFPSSKISLAGISYLDFINPNLVDKCSLLRDRNVPCQVSGCNVTEFSFDTFRENTDSRCAPDL